MKKIIFLLNFSIIVTSVFCQAPELIVNSGHAKEIKSVEYSNDNCFILSASSDNLIKLWDAKTGMEIRTFQGHTEPVSCAKFSTDGKFIFSSSYDRTIRKWDLLTGSELAKLNVDIPPSSFALSNDNRLIATSEGHQISILDLEKNKIVRTIKKKFGCAYVLFTGDDKFILSGGNDGILRLWNVSNGNREREFSCGGYISSLSLSKDGSKILSVENTTIKILDFVSGKLIKSFDIPNETLKSAIFSPDSKSILFYSYSKDLVFIDANSGKIIHVLKGHKESITSFAFSHDGKQIASGAFDMAVKVWDALSGKEINTLAGRVLYISSIATSDNGHVLAIKQTNNTLKLWSLKNGKFIRMLTWINSDITTQSFSKDAKYLMLSEPDNSVVMVNIHNGDIEKRFKGHTAKVVKVIFTPDNKFAISASEDKTLKLWDLNKGLEVRTYKGHLNHIVAVACADNGEAFVSGSMDTAMVWNINSPTPDRIVPNVGKFVSSIAISPDGNTFLTGSGFIYIPTEFPLQLWDIKTGKNLLKFPMKKGFVRSVGFAPDGKTCVSTSGFFEVKKDINEIVLWNISDASKIKTFMGHPDDLTCVSIINNNQTILSASEDGSIKLWNILKGDLQLTIYPFAQSNDWISVTPDGRFDGTIEGMKQLHYVNGMELIPLESYFEEFYKPGLMAQTLSGGEIHDLVDFSKLSLPPTVKILSPENNISVSSSELKLNFQVEDRGNGIGEIRIFQNGKKIQTLLRGFKSVGQNQEFFINLVDGENKIKITAFNNQRTEALPQEITINYKAIQQTKPNMYILAVGINNYLNPKYNLNYAKNDADAFVKSLSTGANSLFGKVEVSSVSDANATREGIVSAIDKITLTAKPEDVFVLYYAGHGVMSSGSETEKSQFYIVPHNVTKMYEADDMLKKSGISATEIGEFSKNIKAQKQLFVIDACQSGGAMQTLAMRGAAEEKAIAQLARSTGTYFIAASGSEQFATEVAELGHGVFTYSVIEALKGSCKSKDGKVTVNLLKSCVEDLVPELSKKYKGQPQFPTGYGFGQDFPIVIVK